MAITLYHCRDARSLRPLWTLEELGSDYKLVNMEFPPRFKHEGYLAINPLGTVPTLIIDGVTMTESTAISQYLAEKFVSANLGLNITHIDYPRYLDWLHRSDTTLTFPQTLILRYGIFEKDGCKLPRIVTDYSRWFLSRLRSVEDALMDRDYLVAGRFTVVDISVGYALILGRKLKLDEQYGPHTLAYLDRITNRDGFRRADAKQSVLKSFF